MRKAKPNVFPPTLSQIVEVMDGRRPTEQQHDVPSATWPGREGRPDQGLGFGWVAVASESNEIPALPALFRVLDLGGTVVTIDTMGCRTARPQPGRLQRGGPKDTHPTLHE